MDAVLGSDPDAGPGVRETGCGEPERDEAAEEEAATASKRGRARGRAAQKRAASPSGKPQPRRKKTTAR